MEAKITSVGSVDNNARACGTLAYMSPEMVNEEEYDNKTDVYSFGVVLFFIMFNSLPKQTLKEKASFKPIKIPTDDANASSFCVHLIEKCLAPECSERPSFENILDELRKNSFQIADDVDSEVIYQRDKQLGLV